MLSTVKEHRQTQRAPHYADADHTVFTGVWVTVGAMAFLTALVLVETMPFRAVASITYDETTYLSLLLRSVRLGRLDDDFATAGVAPLPLLVTYGPPAFLHGGEVRKSLKAGAAADIPLVHAARILHAALFTVPLVLAVFYWLRTRRGLWAGAFGGMMCALSPSILAHGTLATTDLPLALGIIASLASMTRYLRRNTVSAFALMVVSVAASIATKYSGILLVPMGCFALLLSSWRDFASPLPVAIERMAGWLPVVRAVGAAAVRVAIFLVLVAIVTWAFHGFAGTRPQAADGTLRQTPFPIAGALMQLHHAETGQPAFLMGMRSKAGWWYYYPLAVLFKSTPAELLLMVVAGALALKAFIGGYLRRKKGRVFNDTCALLMWAVTAGVILAAAMLSKLDIGHRYVLALYPILFLVATDLMWGHYSRYPRTLRLVTGGLVALQAMSLINIAPDYLSYFNRIVGGPENGYRLLVDSNLDWGQDLPALRNSAESLGCKHMLLHYFGTASPTAYGISYVRAEPGATIPEECDCFAISVTNLQGAYLEDDPYRGVRSLVPKGRAGYSILIYDLKDSFVRQRVQAALALWGQSKAQEAG